MNELPVWFNEPLRNFVKEMSDGGTPSRSNISYFCGNIPWVVITDIQREIHVTKEYLTEKGLASCSSKLWPKESIILSTGATIGKVGLAKVALATKQGITGLTANGRLTPLYLYYALLFKKENIVAWAQGSTFAEIRTPILGKVPLKVPVQLEMQEKISHILQTIDQTIEKTEALIEKYQQIKAGLMHDLFTRGIGADGKLRPPREQAPELYQQTPIGWLPKEWEHAQLKGYVRSVQYGISTSLDDSENGIPVLRMNNIQSNRFDVSDLKYTRDVDAYKIKLKKGDVLYNRTNSMEHVGKTAIWRDELPECSFASYLVRINLYEGMILPEFFSHWMSKISSQNMLRRYATPAVQQVNINPTNLQKVFISCPKSIDEQRKISSKIDLVDLKLREESKALHKLRKQKSGLMHDLLTGKVQVNVDQPEAAHAL